eukprot:COSAG03_NODE_19660_length_332_cov_1.330472_1_plen_62_part_01
MKVAAGKSEKNDERSVKTVLVLSWFCPACLHSAEWTVLPLVMVRDDLLMTGDTSFAAKHFDS